VATPGPLLKRGSDACKPISKSPRAVCIVRYSVAQASDVRVSNYGYDGCIRETAQDFAHYRQDAANL
jgi:hypothetical protein